MKRLVFCFDGTWNKLDAQYPTNVVLTAESVLPLTRENVAQVIFYDEGVGTSKFESLSGGMFGAGLVRNMADGYRFLIFNYSPGDEVYVFGFSRGAYTARSFVGLLRTSGILLRGYASKVNEAIELYRRRDITPEFNEEVLCFRRDNSPDICVTPDEQQWREKLGIPSQTTPRLQVRYLGVWDTVGALGIPSRFAIAGPLDKKFEFHDTSLSAFVLSARHAVAIDERRKDFVPTLWDNTDALNEERGIDPTAPDAPYQQRWFPGVHSSVGGGGERRGLSDQSLDWILDGALSAGLVLDPQSSSRIFELKPDYTEYIENSTEQSLYYRIANKIAAADRLPGPGTIHEVSTSARRRWLEDPKNLKGNTKYRPPTLDRVKGELDKLNPADFGLGEVADSNARYTMYQVRRGDTLRGIAKDLLGSADEADRIFKANLNKLDSPDRIYPGQMLRIPKEADLTTKAP
jgi:uncharacterized protein (DUF2235 family)